MLVIPPTCSIVSLGGSFPAAVMSQFEFELDYHQVEVRNAMLNGKSTGTTTPLSIHPSLPALGLPSSGR